MIRSHHIASQLLAERQRDLQASARGPGLPAVSARRAAELERSPEVERRPKLTGRRDPARRRAPARIAALLVNAARVTQRTR